MAHPSLTIAAQIAEMDREDNLARNHQGPSECPDMQVLPPGQVCQRELPLRTPQGGAVLPEPHSGQMPPSHPYDCFGDVSTSSWEPSPSMAASVCAPSLSMPAVFLQQETAESLQQENAELKRRLEELQDSMQQCQEQRSKNRKPSKKEREKQKERQRTHAGEAAKSVEEEDVSKVKPSSHENSKHAKGADLAQRSACGAGGQQDDEHGEDSDSANTHEGGLGIIPNQGNISSVDQTESSLDPACASLAPDPEIESGAKDFDRWQGLASGIVAEEVKQEVRPKPDAHLHYVAGRGAFLSASLEAPDGDAPLELPDDLHAPGHHYHLPVNAIVSFVEALCSRTYNDEYASEKQLHGEEKASYNFLMKCLRDAGFGLADDLLHFIAYRLPSLCSAVIEYLNCTYPPPFDMAILQSKLAPILDALSMPVAPSTVIGVVLRLTWDLGHLMLGSKTFDDVLSSANMLSYLGTAAVCLSANAIASKCALGLVPAVCATIAISFVVHTAIREFTNPLSWTSRTCQALYLRLLGQQHDSWETSDATIPELMKCPLSQKLFFDPVIVNGVIYERAAIIAKLQRDGKDMYGQPPRLALVRSVPKLKSLCEMFAGAHGIHPTCDLT